MSFAHCIVVRSSRMLMCWMYELGKMAELFVTDLGVNGLRANIDLENPLLRSLYFLTLFLISYL